MFDPESVLPVAVVARAAYLFAGGQPWADIAARLGRTVTEIEALPGHPDWDRLHKSAVRAVAQEAEAEARRELRRGLRSADDEEASAAADEAYRREERRHARRGRKTPRPADPTSDEQLVRRYLELLNDMPAAEFIALEHARQTAVAANVTPE